MGMWKYANSPVSDIESYKAVNSFELAGKELKFTMDGGATISLSFAAYPCKEVCVDGAARGVEYDCVKISDHVVSLTYNLPETFAAYVIDLEKGLVTRIITGNDKETKIAFGAAEGATGMHSFTDDLDGNTVRWTLGKKGESAFLTAYGKGSVTVTRPYAEDAPAISASGFCAVKITNEVYLQTADIQAGGTTSHVIMISNFWNFTCVGSIYGVTAARDAICKLFAGYGRYIGE